MDDDKVLDQSEEVKVEQPTDVEPPKGEAEPVDLAKLKAESEEETKTEPQIESKDEEAEDKLDRRFTQFKGKTLQEYTKELEEAYANSSTEAGKLVAENKRLREEQAAKAGEPDDAPVVAQDPALIYAQKQLDEKMTEEYTDFVKEHPELESDTDLRAKVLEEVTVLGTAYRSQGKILGMRQGLMAAYATLGLDLTEKPSKAEKVREAVKESASNSITGASASVKSDDDFTEAQLDFAKKFGFTKDQLREHIKA